jgi:hypothetical protein
MLEWMLEWMLEQMAKLIAAIPVSRMFLFFGETISEALSVGRPPCAARRTLRREALSSQLISALFGFPHFISSATWPPYNYSFKLP